jgi:hypothetical protein
VPVVLDESTGYFAASIRQRPPSAVQMGRPQADDRGDVRYDVQPMAMTCRSRS